MTPLRILVVDDEPLALRRLKLLLQSTSYCEQVGEASSCTEALEKIASSSPDVILLDIRLRDGNGFDVVQSIAHRPNPPAVIFVTAFDQFAVRAFETSVVDYLLKPVERDRLARALSRAREHLRAMSSDQRVAELQSVVRNLRSAHAGKGQRSYETEFWVRGSSGLVRILVESIDCVSSEDEYVSLHTPGGSHLMRSSLKQFEARVEPDLFVRVHRRWLVRKEAIAEVRTPRLGSSEIVLRNGRRVPAGRVYLKHLRQQLGGLAPAASAQRQDLRQKKLASVLLK